MTCSSISTKQSRAVQIGGGMLATVAATDLGRGSCMLGFLWPLVPPHHPLVLHFMFVWAAINPPNLVPSHVTCFTHWISPGSTPDACAMHISLPWLVPSFRSATLHCQASVVPTATCHGRCVGGCIRRPTCTDRLVPLAARLRCPAALAHTMLCAQPL